MHGANSVSAPHPGPPESTLRGFFYLKHMSGKVRRKEKIEIVDTKLIPQLCQDRRTNNM